MDDTTALLCAGSAIFGAVIVLAAWTSHQRDTFEGGLTPLEKAELMGWKVSGGTWQTYRDFRQFRRGERIEREAQENRTHTCPQCRAEFKGGPTPPDTPFGIPEKSFLTNF